MTALTLNNIVMKQTRCSIANLPTSAEDGRLLIVTNPDLSRSLYVGTGSSVVQVGGGGGGGVVEFDNKGTVTTNITLAENKITTGYWSGTNTITLPTVTDTTKQVACILDFTTATSSQPTITDTNLKWSDKNGGKPPSSYSILSGVRNLLVFKSVWINSVLYWETEYTTYGGGGGVSKFSHLGTFSVNSGTVDSSGNNASLTAPGSGTVIEAWISPVMTSYNTPSGTVTGTGNEQSTSTQYWRAFSDWATGGCTTINRHGATPTVKLAFGEVITATKYYTPRQWPGASVGANAANTCNLYLNGAVVYSFTCTGINTTIDIPNIECDAIELTNFSSGNVDWVSTYPIKLEGYKVISISTADTLILNASTTTPFNVTNASGTSLSTTANKTLNCSLLGNTTYNIFQNISNGSIYPYANTIYRQANEPSSVPFVQPVLSGNGTMGGNTFAVNSSGDISGYEPWKAFDGITSTKGWASNTNNGGWITFYNPLGLNVTLLKITNNFEGIGFNVITSGVIYGSNDNSNFTQLKSFSNSITDNSAVWNIDLSDNYSFYKYYKLNVTSTSNPSYQPVITEMLITATTTSTIITNDIWLKTLEPLTAYKYSSSDTWEAFNDVPIGSITIANGLITAVKNLPFNYNGLGRKLYDSYKNGTSWYNDFLQVNPENNKIEHWIEQGGIIDTGTTFTLLKPFKDTNYSIACSFNGNNSTSSTQYQQIGYHSKTETTISGTRNYGAALEFTACGYGN